MKTEGARIEVLFPGFDAGIFSGALQYTVYRGTNLLRQEIIAKTNELSAAYKYVSGLKGFAIGDEEPASSGVTQRAAGRSTSSAALKPGTGWLTGA